jgi:hypothetical protein
MKHLLIAAALLAAAGAAAASAEDPKALSHAVYAGGSREASPEVYDQLYCTYSAKQADVLARQGRSPTVVYETPDGGKVACSEVGRERLAPNSLWDDKVDRGPVVSKWDKVGNDEFHVHLSNGIRLTWSSIKRIEAIGRAVVIETYDGSRLFWTPAGPSAGTGPAERAAKFMNGRLELLRR